MDRPDDLHNTVDDTQCQQGYDKANRRKTDVFGVTAYSDFPLWPDEETMDKQHYIWKVMNDGFAMAEPF